MSYYSPEELREFGFLSLGEDVRLSRKASVYSAERIRIGNHVRIDDFVILSAGEGGFDIGSYIHIAAYTSLIGAGAIRLEDFSNLSSRVSIYSSSDDYSGRAMTNPMVPKELTDVDSRPVTIGRHVIIGAGSVVLPGSVLHEGAAVGALSLVKGECEAFGIYSGVPARRISQRSDEFLELEKRIAR